jgi:hypothetical protein
MCINVRTYNKEHLMDVPLGDAVERYSCSRSPGNTFTTREGTMKIFIYCCVFALLTVTSLPITAEAFSRRAHHDEVPQGLSAPQKDTTHTNNAVGPNTPGNNTPTNVPETSSLLLMGVGIGLLGIYAMKKRFRGQVASPNKEM